MGSWLRLVANGHHLKSTDERPTLKPQTVVQKRNRCMRLVVPISQAVTPIEFGDLGLNHIRHLLSQGPGRRGCRLHDPALGFRV